MTLENIILGNVEFINITLGSVSFGEQGTTPDYIMTQTGEPILTQGNDPLFI